MTSDWKELPKPATPGPWASSEPIAGFSPRWGVLAIIGPEDDPEDETLCEMVHRHNSPEDARAIAALPEYIAEVERLRAWVDWFRMDGGDGLSRLVDQIRAGEWPDA
jgi:hypothetical protein